MFKKLLTLALTVTMAFSVTTFSNADSAVKVKVDGKEISLDASPVIEAGRTLVPIRSVAEALGADVQWDGGTSTATVYTIDNEIVIKIGSTTATVNGSEKTLDAAAKIIGGRTMLPLRFVGESLGAEVSYDASTSTVSVDYFTKMSGTLKIGGSTTIQPICQAVADKLLARNSGLSITVAGGGSGVGLTGANDGTLNIGAYSTELSDADRATYPDIVDTHIGSDGVAIIISPLNTKVTNLTKQQVYDIFTGKITNWKDVGGDDAAIFVQTREATSGTLKAFMELAIQKADKNAKIVGTATPHASSGLILQAVASNKNAIGFESFGYLNNTVNAVKVDGVSATAANALSKKWAYVRPLNILTKGQPSGLNAKFINYLLSPEGQTLITDLKYIPLKVKD